MNTITTIRYESDETTKTSFHLYHDELFAEEPEDVYLEFEGVSFRGFERRFHGSNSRTPEGRCESPDKLGEEAEANRLRKNPMEDPSASEKRMLEETKRAVLPEMRTADEISALTGLPIDLLRRNLQEWQASGRIFAVEENDIEYFPLFALDPHAHYQPYTAVAVILRILGALMSPWGIAAWFVAANSFLDEQRPQDLLAVDPAWVIDAASDEAEECQWN